LLASATVTTLLFVVLAIAELVEVVCSSPSSWEKLATSLIGLAPVHETAAHLGSRRQRGTAP